MSNITTEKANELFWLGRYVERVYTTCMEFFKGYDRMIDEQEVSYPDYCRRVSIPNVYADKEDFLRNYPFDDSNPDSIISNLIRAYDNAVVLRDDIGSDTLQGRQEDREDRPVPEVRAARGQDLVRGQQAPEQDRQDRAELRPGRHTQAQEHARPGERAIRGRHTSHRVHGGRLSHNVKLLAHVRAAGGMLPWTPKRIFLGSSTS